MDIDFSDCAKGSDEHLLRWVLAHLDEAYEEGRLEAVRPYIRALEYLASKQAGSPKAVIFGYRTESGRPGSRQLVAA